MLFPDMHNNVFQPLRRPTTSPSPSAILDLDSILHKMRIMWRVPVHAQYESLQDIHTVRTTRYVYAVRRGPVVGGHAVQAQCKTQDLFIGPVQYNLLVR
jgi:hypothetical protein